MIYDLFIGDSLSYAQVTQKEKKKSNINRQMKIDKRQVFLNIFDIMNDLKSKVK